MPVTAEYWFARRYPVGNPRNGMAPVHWKGWAVAGAFVLTLLIGALAFATMAVGGYLIQGALAFAIAALLGGGWFVVVANAKCDKTRTVADYRQETPGA